MNRATRWLSKRRHQVEHRDRCGQLSDNPAGSFRFPGSGAFATSTTGEHVSVPAGAGTVLYKSSAAEGEGGDGVNPQGAIVYDSAPSESLAVYRGSGEATSSGFDMPFLRTIPAAGSYTLRMAFVQGYGLAEVTRLAEEAQASYYPAVSILSPATGTSITSPSPAVTVSGNASDSVALSSLTVDGKAVSVAGDAFSTSVALSPGANTITAIATNQAGNSKAAAVSVTYTPPSGSEEHPGGGSSTTGSAGASSTSTPAAHASQVGAVSAANGRVAFTLACENARCDVQATLTTSERRRGTKVLGVAARTASKQVTVGSATLTITAAQQRLVVITLNATGRALLKKFGKLPVHLSVELLGGSVPASIISSNLTIKPPPRKRSG